MRSLPRFRPILIEKLQEAQNGPGFVSAAAASHYSGGEEQYDTSAGREKMPVSFERDIRPLFRQIDIEHMNKHKVLLDNFAYMADPSNDHGNAQAVEDSLTNQSMPPGGPYWSSEELTLYRQWKSDGYLP
jgi:hypothetical protein